MKQNWQEELRFLLNNFLQDLDSEAKIDSGLANRIVDVHLVKFSSLLTAEIEALHSELDRVREEANRQFIYELKMRLAPDNEFGEVWTMSEKERQELLDMFPITHLSKDNK